ncbi:unnamed protein product [Clonostachys chloroleuca]|uniref:NmrA-like domain-containing protein n=1 Tax=Clonostachys chloroleuca TaxID=1926264 RepID=A0AA35LQL2_9HYPO|nr:unnamed protein product [Clonostachys chloroleuca]
MGVVAVAGGTGHMGRSIVDALVASKKHKTVILSRKPNPDLERELGVPIIAVDYDNVKAVTEALEQNNVDTVISAIMMMPGPGGDPKEIQLIRAADLSKTTKRIISSDYGLPHSEGHDEQLPSVIYKKKAQEELKTVKDLETTRIICGQFMDYWGIPGVKSHFSAFTIAVDIANDAAAIPGDGNTPVIMTHTSDVGKYVAASLDLEKWDPVHYIASDKVSLNELLSYAEEAKGKKFSVTYDSVESLKQGHLTELPGQAANYEYIPKEVLQKLLVSFHLWYAEGVFNFEHGTTLNDKFPDIKPLKVKEMIDRAWKKE